MGSGERSASWRTHRRGAASAWGRFPISQVKRTEGRQVVQSGLPPFFLVTKWQGRDGKLESWDCAHRFSIPTSRPGPAPSTSAAGTCRSTTARRSRSTTPVRRDAGMFDVSHMCVVDLRGDRVRDYLRRLLANDVARLTQPGKALYSCMLRRAGGVIDDLIVYFRTSAGSAWSSTPARATRTSRGCARWRRLRRGGRAAHRPRDDRGAGPERAAQGRRRHGAGDRTACARDRAVHRHRRGQPLRRTHRLHRRGRLRDHAAGRTRRGALARPARLRA